MTAQNKTTSGENPATLPLAGTELIRIVQSGDNAKCTAANIAALAALPLTTKGDLVVYGTSAARLGVGSDGTALLADSAQTLGTRWGDPTAALVTNLASTTDATKAAGQIGFLYSLAYTGNTVGAWLKGLATSAGSTFIGWIQSGTGAVLRTVQDKLRDTVSVFDFMTSAQIADAKSGTPTLDTTAAFASALATAKKVLVPSATYLANIVASSAFNIEGDGMQKTIIKPFSTSLPAFKNMANPGSANFWRRSRIAHLSLISSGTVGNGFTFGDPALYTTGDEQIGRVDFDNVEITGFNKAIFKTCGNIGNTYRNCRVNNNNYSHYAQSSDYASGSAPMMHTGLDLWEGGSFGYAGLAAIFVRDNIAGKGGWQFRGTDIEGCTGHAFLMFGTLFDYAPDLYIDASWIEANATSGSVTTDSGTAGTPLTTAPQDFYLSGIKHVIGSKIWLQKVTVLNGTNFIAQTCYYDTATPLFTLTKDASSTFVHDGAASNTGVTEQLVLAPYASDNWTSTTVTTSTYNVLPGAIFGPVTDATVRAGYSGTSVMTGSAGVIRDGLSAPTCNQFSVTTGGTAPVSSITTVVGKYYAVSVQARLVSGAGGIAYVGNLASATGIPITSSEWRQFNFVRLATMTTSFLTIASTSGTAVVNVGAFQVVEFSNAQDAQNYLYRGRLATNNDARAAGPQMSALTALGGGFASLNTAQISCQITTAAYSEILQAQFGSAVAKIQMDALLAGEDFNTGNTQAQPIGFTSATFSSVADAAQTFSIGAATVTMKWVAVSGNLYALQGKITAGASTTLNLAGIAFFKGK